MCDFTKNSNFNIIRTLTKNYGHMPAAIANRKEHKKNFL